MAQVENHFTVFIRLPFGRGDFVDPPPVAWSAEKERALWDVISRQAKGNEIDWTGLADQLEVTQPFLLQQAAWLYERQLSQVRAQMRRVGVRQSATPSPASASMSNSMVGGQAMKRAGSGGSKVPARMLVPTRDTPSPAAAERSAPGTPVKSRGSLPFRPPSGLIGSQLRGPAAASNPMSRQSSKESHTPTVSHSRRPSGQHPGARSPVQARRTAADSSASEDDLTASRVRLRRVNPSATSRRGPLSRREPERRRSSLADDDEDGDDDEEDSDASPFLPFASATTNIPERTSGSHSHQDPSATLRGGFTSSTSTAQTQRPALHRRTTSERIASASASAATTTHPPPRPSRLASSASSASSGPTPTTARYQHQATLSPRQRAALHSARAGSDTSPSMGSSFSDLDDASITQSALEEALASNMAHGNSHGSSTNGEGTSVGRAIAGRVLTSGIGQALRTGRGYFEGQGQGGRGRGG